MPAYPDLAAYFFEMEKLVEAQPDSVIAEIDLAVARTASKVVTRRVGAPLRRRRSWKTFSQRLRRFSNG
jgi:hypothetical protein